MCVNNLQTLEKAFVINVEYFLVLTFCWKKVVEVGLKREMLEIELPQPQDIPQPPSHLQRLPYADVFIRKSHCSILHQWLPPKWEFSWRSHYQTPWQIDLAGTCQLGRILQLNSIIYFFLFRPAQAVLLKSWYLKNRMVHMTQNASEVKWPYSCHKFSIFGELLRRNG